MKNSNYSDYGEAGKAIVATQIVAGEHIEFHEKDHVEAKQGHIISKAIVYPL